MTQELLDKKVTEVIFLINQTKDKTAKNHAMGWLGCCLLTLDEQKPEKWDKIANLLDRIINTLKNK